MSRKRIAWIAALLLGAASLYAGMAMSPEPRPVATPSPDAPSPPPMSVPRCEELGWIHASVLESYPMDSQGTFELSLSPEGAQHLNDDYPTSVHLVSSSGIVLASSELTRENARSTDDGLSFDVAFTPSRIGEHDVTVEVDYALCSDTECLPSTCRFHVRLNAVA